MKTVLIILGVILILGVLGFIFASIGLKDIKNMAINDVNLSEIPDGVYEGNFKKARWNHEVKVTVKDHKIVSIEKKNLSDDKRDREITEKAGEAIIANQSVKIDVISGATVDTKSFQKAVENALTER